MARSDRDESQSSEQVAAIARRLLERQDELADQMTAAITAAVPLYRTGLVDHDTLRTTSLVHLQAILGSLGRNPATTSPESRENGRRRAAAGVPLAAILEAYRVAARFMWEQVADAVRSLGAGSEIVLQAGSEMWQVLDTYSQELADGYREEAAAQALSAEQQRSALFQALFEGHLAATNPWEAAELLRLPPNGPLVVVAAEVPAIGRHALLRAEQALRDVGLTSAWRLLPDVEIGVVSLPGPAAQLDRLADALSTCASGRVGVSPPYSDLRTTPQALVLARIALTSTLPQRGVTVFDRDLLAAAAVGAPDVMNHLAQTALAGLAALPDKERASLLETFEAWLDSNGSAQAAAERLYVHRNTIHHRLRKLEQLTGHDLANPRSATLLTLAFEIERRQRHGTTEGSFSRPRSDTHTG
jgi:PucR C-terminal helix-turn-helix domain/GGDEF-like domain